MATRRRTRPKATGPAELVPALHWVAEQARLFNPEESPFAASVVDGAPRLAVITGENAAGKSLFFRILAIRLSDLDLKAVTISIRERTGAGQHEMAGMRRIMMFGDEHEQSTGATSVGTIATGFRQLEDPSALLLDEPEIGLSDGYTHALGQYIGQQATQMPDTAAGVVVVTHSRRLVEGILSTYGQTPTFVSCTAEGAPAVASLEEWLASVEERSIEDLFALKDAGLRRWRATNALLRD